LLMAALLADLRDSFALTANSRSGAVVLLDNGDAPSARAFVRTLVRVRKQLRHQRVPRDPLVVITTSGGNAEPSPSELAPSPPIPSASASSQLADQAPRWSETDLEGLTADDVRLAGQVLRVTLTGLAKEDVQQVARGKLWPAGLGTRDIAASVHRLTGGHAEGVTVILEQLTNHPDWVDSLDQVLSSAEDDTRTVEQHLLDKIVKGLSPGKHDDAQLRDDLITLSAARDNVEADLLTPELGHRARAGSALFASTCLWSARSLRGHPAMPPFVRFLLLRALAARPADHPQSWKDRRLRGRPRSGAFDTAAYAKEWQTFGKPITASFRRHRVGVLRRVVRREVEAGADRLLERDLVGPGVDRDHILLAPEELDHRVDLAVVFA
jgi:hypothetical protein